MSRTRSRSGFNAYSGFDTGWATTLLPFVYETFYEASYPGSTACHHQKINGGSSLRWQNVNFAPGRTWTLDGYLIPGYVGCSDHITEINNEIQKHASRLNWRSLDSSSRASLIQTLAEFDETLLLFTKRFWAQLNYGAFTWGIVPFVSDVRNWAQATIRAFRSLSNDSKYHYRDKFSQSVKTDWVPGVAGFDSRATCDYTLRRSGRYTLTSIASQLQWLDRLGIHPDIATIYDLVPFSFAVDYFLPIGEFLTNTFQRGWVNEISFSGWMSVESHIKYDFRVSSGSQQTSISGSCGQTIFSRFPDASILHTEPVKFDIPGFDLPTLQQIFNTQYLLLTNSGKLPVIKKPAKVIL